MHARRPRLTPAVADLRRAVREHLASALEPSAHVASEVRSQPLVLVALSGGQDSLALAAALAFEAPRAGLRAGAVVIDHGLQEGSADVSAQAAEQAKTLGLDPVLIERVAVSGSGGIEATARQARYAALDRLVFSESAAAVLLGHTLDDQAETVLLGLARGSGGTSLSGMSPVNGFYHRPLLGIRRATTLQACLDQGLEPWHDPHNDDPQFLRVRVRNTVLPTLERELGPGISEALARSAEQSREDADALDEAVVTLLDEVIEVAEGGIALSVVGLSSQPAALRNRLIRRVVRTEFETSLSREHTLAVARLVTEWHGQDALHLPGIRVERVRNRLVFTPTPAESDTHTRTLEKDH
jgi:tRNA(Ile)-lysidine synthase